MQFDTAEIRSVQDLSEIYIKNNTGEMLPLGSVVKKVESRNEPIRYRDEYQGTTYVNAELERRSVVYAVIDLLFDLNNYQLSDGGKLDSWNLFGLHYRSVTGDLYSIEWGGEWKMTLENFRDLGIAMIVAFILIYAVLVAQFRSFSAPALIMTTIPLGFLGIMPGFALLDLTSGTFLTATSLIGFVALMGIVVNNAILYLEYFDQLREKGIELKEALVEAGRVRLRPIMLTSFTTVLGTLTIAGDPVWSGLAWAIVFGLSLSVLMTLGVFPVLYYLVKPKR
jgi:multidrug efflux pump subunit AcrB